MPKRWIVRETCPPDFVLTMPDAHPAVPQLLWNRGIKTPEDAARFFEPSFEEGIHDPFVFTQMRTAVERLLTALSTGEKIVVFGDYDADGITGSTVLMTTLREIEGKMGSWERETGNAGSRSRFQVPSSNISSYIPHRDKEGYGLQMASVAQLADEGAKVIVTVDCGIACVNEIAEARRRGVDVVVVDHHQFGETLPDAVLIHPGIPGEAYPFKSLAAVGVAWKLASALLAEARSRALDIPESYEKWLLDLVAIATVTDIVPLVGENRVLEHYGLKVLNRSRRPGLAALFERAGLTRGDIKERDVGFAIGPRLNAAGRMDHASVALRLLLAETEEEALDLSHRLETLNRMRQAATQEMMVQAERMLLEASENARLHVLWHEAWSPALVGLVAGKIADRYGMPAVAIGKHGSHWIGSGRSYPAYDITAAVQRVGDGLLTRSGGHVQACGFALADDGHVPVFAERLQQDAGERLTDADLGPTLDVDVELPLEDVSWPLTDTIGRFAPYGCGNPEPTFVSRGLHVVSSGTVGQDGRHLRFVAKSSLGTAQKFIAFNHGKRIADAPVGGSVDVVYTVGVNEWNGRKEIQCKVVDFHAA
ncbi:MAG TPA: single-stranded-DNA-specific exonuclease RecJ [Candidatus Methylomirabilis sp.]|nr:single-stranded-DNA-specific exonuclease RecJ [Candidatus Methylomirabilis sp.]